MPIPIPQGVQVKVEDGQVTVEGPKGTLHQSYLPEVEFQVEDNICRVTRKSDSRQARSLHGLYRKLVANMVTGVSQGFSKILQINGVGYRGEVQKDALVLNLGFSNPIEYTIPEGIKIQVEANTRIVVSGIDKQQVGQVAAEIRSFRPPEPYKGKGIRYENETVRRKVGKSGIK
jgi:large subunit ribosomal protein L6